MFADRSNLRSTLYHDHCVAAIFDSLEADFVVRRTMATDSGQKFIRRNRAPRVHITYEDPYDAERLIELPFVMGVLSDLSGNNPGVEKPEVDERKFLEFDMDNFDNRMAAIEPGVTMRVANKLGDGDRTRSCRSICDSTRWTTSRPAAVARQVPALAKLLEAREQLANLLRYMDGKVAAEDQLKKLLADPQADGGAAASARAAGDEPETESEENSVTGRPWRQKLSGRAEHGAGRDARSRRIRAVLKQSFKPRTERAATEVENAVTTLVSRRSPTRALVKDDVLDTIEEMIARLDEKLTAQMNEIMHAPEFQQIESAWRGLHYLVFNSETDANLKIRVMNVSQERALPQPAALSRRALGPEPAVQEGLRVASSASSAASRIGCLVGDYYFSHLPTDVQLLRDSQQDRRRRARAVLRRRRPDPARHGLAGPSCPIRATSARSSTRRTMRPGRGCATQDDSRYVGLCMPRVLSRLPYGAKSEPVEEFAFEEETDGHNGEKYALDERRLCDGRRTSTAPSRNTAGARASAACSRAARSSTCRPTPSRPTTAASTSSARPRSPSATGARPSWRSPA